MWQPRIVKGPACCPLVYAPRSAARYHQRGQQADNLDAELRLPAKNPEKKGDKRIGGACEPNVR